LNTARLDLLLHSYGIASEFIEFSGNVAHIALENRLHILGTMGIAVTSDAHLEQLLRERELAEVEPWLPAALMLDEERPVLSLSLDTGQADAELHWRLFLENAGTLEGTVRPHSLSLCDTVTVAGRTFEKRELTLPRLPCGYHQLLLSSGAVAHDSLLVVAPRQTWQPECILQGRRLWGLSTQLYSIRSADNWGMGDFADLRQLVTLAAAAGADFVLLNPLHMLDLRYPENASPYSPSDRRFLNPLYIAAGLCEDYQAIEVQALVKTAAFQRELSAVRATGNVDYSGVHKLKMQALVLMYRSFMQQRGAAASARAASFHTFIATGGTPLQNFAAQQTALFSTLADAEQALHEPDFHLYLQWVVTTQLEECQHQALAAGMAVGLIRDLAVGSSVDGCEVTTNPDLFCTNARIGAPPDNFNPDGQNWGLPPLQPQMLLPTRFAHFIALLQANMRACGALRIDHVMALMRLWWCPDDGSNASGAYVHYPVNMLFAILRLESQRNRCMVIGEDLGVVPPAIRSFLEEGAIFSNSVFYFEKYDGWHFRKPEHYRQQALAMIANHDVPPLKAWWNASDLVLRRAIGLIAHDDKLRTEQAYRDSEKQQLLQWLAEQGLLPMLWEARNCARPLDAELTLAIVKACARVTARLLSLQLDDLAGVDTPVNIPGTSDEYANWRRKIPVALEDIFTNTVARDILQALREARTA
jgi:4-alpha-glucanotransferase